MIEIIWLILTALCLLSGLFFTGVAALGLRTMPDTYLRMSAATKASTLGSAGFLLAAGIQLGNLTTFMQVILTIFFILVTAPVAAHIIGRAGYRKHKAPLWQGTVIDDLKQYEAERNDS